MNLESVTQYRPVCGPGRTKLVVPSIGLSSAHVSWNDVQGSLDDPSGVIGDLLAAVRLFTDTSVSSARFPGPYNLCSG